RTVINFTFCQRVHIAQSWSILSGTTTARAQTRSWRASGADRTGGLSQSQFVLRAGEDDRARRILLRACEKENGPRLLPALQQFVGRPVQFPVEATSGTLRCDWLTGAGAGVFCPAVYDGNVLQHLLRSIARG